MGVLVLWYLSMMEVGSTNALTWVEHRSHCRCVLYYCFILMLILCAVAVAACNCCMMCAVCCCCMLCTVYCCRLLLLQIGASSILVKGYFKI